MDITSPQREYTLDDFSYDLPPELIAQEPLAIRHNSKLLHIKKGLETFSHHHFKDIPSLLNPGDLLVMNNTKVIPARIYAHRDTGGLIEILLLKAQTQKPGVWEAMATPIRRLKKGEILKPVIDKQKLSEVSKSGVAEASNLTITVHDIFLDQDGYKRILVDLGSGDRAFKLLSQAGFAPLPPYIRRELESNKNKTADLESYQTVFAKAPGAVAAPTAGLHFSKEVLEQLKDKGVETCELTLHVGAGTFKPITTSIKNHTVEAETYSLSVDTANILNKALKEKRRIIAVGTTSCRTLETAGAAGIIEPADNTPTRLYIQPGHQFKVVSGLITNFHLSRSSLLVLVSAFAGRDLIMHAYSEAIKERYRFYSYGDACFIT
jgi:S-adenosylmethionine:tRNA ribosyltransferase-isomerase